MSSNKRKNSNKTITESKKSKVDAETNDETTNSVVSKKLNLNEFKYNKSTRNSKKSSISNQKSNTTDSNFIESNINEEVNVDPKLSGNISEELLTLECALCENLKHISFPKPVKYVYNPLEYAFDIHAIYVRKYCTMPKKILFLGMNPGPWGMSQTGVPFGEISMVRDWLKISGPVGKPDQEHPDRQITGFECTRSEVSGKRLWGFFKQLCGNPDKFFENAYVHNYCPIALMDERARNITPADLKSQAVKLIISACDKSLASVLKLLQVEIIVGIGKFAEKRSQSVVAESGLPIKVLSITHPSPRVVGNEKWDEKVTRQLKELQLIEYFT